jgi:hypothetical protein
MATITIEQLNREKEGISKLVKKNLVIANTFFRMGDDNFANDHLGKVYIFAKQLWQIDLEIKQQSISHS